MRPCRGGDILIKAGKLDRICRLGKGIGGGVHETAICNEIWSQKDIHSALTFLPLAQVQVVVG